MADNDPDLLSHVFFRNGEKGAVVLDVSVKELARMIAALLTKALSNPSQAEPWQVDDGPRFVVTPRQEDDPLARWEAEEASITVAKEVTRLRVNNYTAVLEQISAAMHSPIELDEIAVETWLAVLNGLYVDEVVGEEAFPVGPYIGPSGEDEVRDVISRLTPVALVTDYLQMELLTLVAPDCVPSL